MSAPVKIKRDLFITGGMWVVGAAAILASWTGWTGLAELAGWTAGFSFKIGGVTVSPHVSWLYGIAVDWFAAVAVRIWVVAHWASPKTRRAAKAWTYVAMGLGMAANAVYLVLEHYHVASPLLIVILIGSTPPFMAGVVIHMAVRYGDDRRQALAGGAVEDLVRREPLLLRTLGAVRFVRDSVQEFRDEVAPAAQEGIDPPAQPQARVRPRHRLEVLEGGDSRMSRMRNYYLTQQAAGWPDTDGRALSGADLDRKFGGRTLGRKAIASVRDEREELSS